MTPSTIERNIRLGLPVVRFLQTRLPPALDTGTAAQGRGPCPAAG